MVIVWEITTLDRKSENVLADVTRYYSEANGRYHSLIRFSVTEGPR